MTDVTESYGGSDHRLMSSTSFDDETNVDEIGSLTPEQLMERFIPVIIGHRYDEDILNENAISIKEEPVAADFSFGDSETDLNESKPIITIINHDRGGIDDIFHQLQIHQHQNEILNDNETPALINIKKEVDIKKEVEDKNNNNEVDNIGSSQDDKTEDERITRLRIWAEEEMTNVKIRRCQNCNNALLAEEDGCNHIVCVCGATMCYVCRKPDVKYVHFCVHARTKGQPCRFCLHSKCSLWSSTEDDDKKAIEKVREAAMNELRNLGISNEIHIGATETRLPRIRQLSCSFEIFI